MGSAFSSEATPDGRPAWVPADAETQIAFKCKYFNDEYDTVMRDTVQPQRKNTSESTYSVPLVCFITRMITDFPQYEAYAPQLPRYRMRTVNNGDGEQVRQKLIEDPDDIHNSTNAQRWVELEYEENEMVDAYERYMELVEELKRKLSYCDGVHQPEPVEIPRELAEDVIRFYRTTYIEGDSKKMQELAKAYLANEWRRRAAAAQS